jgi:formiminotetrahydrofolate cyclodeaminase
MSIGDTTVETFRQEVGASQPVPAGVSIACVSAGLALSLLAKVLDITSRRKDFEGDAERIQILLKEARSESAGFTHLADNDVEAFNEYLERSRAHDAEGVQAAMGRAVEVPMEGARAVVRGLDLCLEGMPMVKGLTLADLVIAAAMLHGAIRAMLVSVDFNLLHLKLPPELADKLKTERRELEFEAARRDDIITTFVRNLLL